MSLWEPSPFFSPGLYSAGKLSSLLKSGSTRVVHILTYPTPPHIMHLQDTPFTFLNRELEKRLVFNVPAPLQQAHVES